MTPEERARITTGPRNKLSDAERMRLPRLNVPPKAMNKPHSAMLLPAKYVRILEHNQKLNLCCRHVEESGHTAQWFASPTAETSAKGETVPDILIIRCGHCDRRHIRFMCGAGIVPMIKDVR